MHTIPFYNKLLTFMDDSDIEQCDNHLAGYQENVTGYHRDIRMVLYPRTQKQVRAIVQAANETDSKLYPISTGKNWGFGSKLPVDGDCHLINLHRHMNRIIEVNEKHGYASVEPGVTQRQLSDYLSEKGLPYYVDVTGSGRETSIVGNFLDRGVGFNRVRCEDLVNLEVVLGNGQVVKTGYSHFVGSKLSHLYPYGVGPDINGLFLQSNMGIITRLTLKLHPKRKYHYLMVAFLNDEAKLGEMAEDIGKLKSAGTVTSIVHLFNQARLNLAEEDSVATRYIASKAWAAIGGISADSLLELQITKQRIRKKLRKYGGVSFFGERTLSLAYGLLNKLGFQGFADAAMMLKNLRNLTCGIPTDMAIAKLASLIATPKPLDIPDLDHCQTGMMFCCPMTPTKAKDVMETIRIVQEIGLREGIRIPHTFMMSSDRVLANVIMLVFDRQNANERAKIHSITAEIYRECAKVGYTPYRIDIENMPQLIHKEDPFWRLLQSIKLCTDPKNTIAQGRYIPNTDKTRTEKV